MWWGGGATNSRSIEIEFLLITSTRAFPTQPTLDAKYVGIKKKKKKKKSLEAGAAGETRTAGTSGEHCCTGPSCSYVDLAVLEWRRVGGRCGGLLSTRNIRHC